MTAPMSYIALGDQCVGFLIWRGRSGAEGFDSNEISLGLFPTETEAAKAVLASAAKNGDTHDECCT
jgi:hypothetical protein